MANAAAKSRARGSIRRRGNSLQVLVYAGVDPLSGQRMYLSESTTDENEARRILSRLQAEVDEQRNAKTRAPLGVAMDEWLKVHDVEENTRQGYETYIRRYIRPALGDVSVGKITPKVLEGFYAELRRCRVRCDGSPRVDHRTERPHECRVVRHRRAPGRRPAGAPPHDCAVAGCVVTECPPHRCRPLSASMIRQLHTAISATLAAAVRWEWIKSNPAGVVKKPRQPAPQPNPPSPEQAAQIIEAAWEQGDDLGTFVWLTMVTGMRRGELLALRWPDVDFTTGRLEIRRNYVWTNGRGVEKDTKTHQMRRISLDPATIEVLTAHRERYEQHVRALGLEPSRSAFLFSNEPDFGTPYNPSATSHRYADMCAKLDIDSHLHALRHYSATELQMRGIAPDATFGRFGDCVLPGPAVAGWL